MSTGRAAVARLTDEELRDAIERAASPGGSLWKSSVLAMATELLEARALIAALKAEGCPAQVYETGFNPGRQRVHLLRRFGDPGRRRAGL